DDGQLPAMTTSRSWRCRHTRWPPHEGRLYGTGLGPTANPRCESPLGWRELHQQDRCGPPTFLPCSPKRLTKGSRTPTPAGSQPGFPEGHVATPIRPITGRRSLAPASFTRSRIGVPYGSLSLTGRLRAYHVPSLSPDGLGRAFSPVVQRLR